MLLGARQLFDESDKVKTGYVFNKYNNTFKDEDGIISGFKDKDTRDWVGYDGPIKWSDFSSFRIVVKYYVGSDFVGWGSCPFISRRYDDASNGVHEVAAPILVGYSYRRGTSTLEHSFSWNPPNYGSWGPTRSIVFAWALNKWFWLMYEFTGTAYNIKYSENGTTWTLVDTYVTMSKPNDSHLWFGAYAHGSSRPQYVSAGSKIDMNNTYIVADGREWWRGRIAS